MRTRVAARRITLLSACMLVFMTLVVPARGQLLQGSITGNVTDTGNAAVPNATVTATEQQTNFARETTTNTAGEYSLPAMPPGVYRITVTAPSFQTVTVLGVSVSPEEVHPQGRCAGGEPVEPDRAGTGRGSRSADGPGRHPR
jgi:Carboxypeptidase regulatory-like domain